MNYRQESHHAKQTCVENEARRIDLFCFSHLRWDFVTQRPQHLLRRAARTRRVFFWEEPVWDGREELGETLSRLEVLRVEPNILVLKPHLRSGVDAEITQKTLLTSFFEEHAIKSFDAWYYTPMALAFTEDLHPVVTVYDCMDELSHFKGAPPALVENEKRLFARADVVFTGGVSLFEAKRTQHGNVHAFPSSIEREHFAQATREDLREPDDQSMLLGPKAGFYGVIDERFDTDLFRKVALLRPDIQFIILGPVVKIDRVSLPHAKNIHYLGSKTYDELPSYLRGWDVALLLFALNHATKFISPTKTPEYLAAGKPVVSTPIRDVVRSYAEEGLVRIAATAEEFAYALDEALKPQDALWAAAVDAKLSQTSWDRTWDCMDAEIEKAREQKEQEKKNRELSAAHLGLRGVAHLNMNTVVNPLASSRRGVHSEKYDYLVVGAGFAGSVLAERLASQGGKRVLLIDRRDHIGGNAYDYYDESGLLVHRYGPHIFHTNSEEVFTYLSRFTTWLPYEHRVLASVEGKLLPIPINLNTINQLYGLDLDRSGMERFLAQRAVHSSQIRTSEDIVVSRVGRELYELFFRNYTRKQWGLDPSQLDSAVAGRIPVRTNQDDRYFTDDFQFMPEHGYTRMFERMLEHPKIKVRLGVEFRDVAKAYPGSQIVFTGPIDEYYGFRYGPLPYRSLEFRHETHDCEFFQRAPVVNYPNDQEYTRITEFKYLTGQVHSKTSIVFEYPRSQGDPYYPIPRAENAQIYARYRDLAQCDEHVVFCGRLANYKYFNMDQVVAQALQTFRRMAEQESLTIPPYRAEPALLKAENRLVGA